MTAVLDNNDEIAAQLKKDNPTLSPDKLSRYFNEYAQYERNLDRFGIWQKPDFEQKLKEHQNKYDKVLLLLSGVAGGGKDALRETITHLYPEKLFKVVTATSRQPRADETNKVDYYFYDSPQAFQQAVDQNDFIEHVIQGTRHYGLPKQSLTDALSQNTPISCSHVEMSAWPKVEEFIHQESAIKPFIFKIFVMPQVKYHKYADEWLPAKRDEAQERLTRTHWELAHAPKHADLILSNFNIDQPNAPFLEWQSNALLRHVWQILKPELDFSNLAN